MARDGGSAARALLLQIAATAEELHTATSEDLRAIGEALGRAVREAERCIEFIVANYGRNIRNVLAGSVPFLELMGLATGGWQMGRAAIAAHRRLGTEDNRFLAAKITTARFFADHEMSGIPGLASQVISGSASVLALPDDSF